MNNLYKIPLLLSRLKVCDSAMHIASCSTKNSYIKRIANFLVFSLINMKFLNKTQIAFYKTANYNINNFNTSSIQAINRTCPFLFNHCKSYTHKIEKKACAINTPFKGRTFLLASFLLTAVMFASNVVKAQVTFTVTGSYGTQVYPGAHNSLNTGTYTCSPTFPISNAGPTPVILYGVVYHLSQSAGSLQQSYYWDRYEYTASSNIISYTFPTTLFAGNGAAAPLMVKIYDANNLVINASNYTFTTLNSCSSFTFANYSTTEKYVYNNLLTSTTGVGRAVLLKISSKVPFKKIEFRHGNFVVTNVKTLPPAGAPVLLYAPSYSTGAVCSAGTTAPAVTPTTANNTCPTATVNLGNLAISSTTPSGASLIWSTHRVPTSAGDTLTTAQKAAVSMAGKYYALYYDKINSCHSPADSITVSTTPCCSAGTTAPILTPTTATNSCPTAMVNLGSLAISSAPSGAKLIWSTHRLPTSAGDTLTAAQKAAVGTAGKYYALFYDKINNCYSPADSVTITITPCCSAGTTAPAVTPTTAANSCPTTTISLGSLAISSTTPSGASLIWSTHHVPTSAGDTLTAAQKVAVSTTGKYYALFYDKINNCYSPADSVSITMNSCGPVQSTVTLPPVCGCSNGETPSTNGTGTVSGFGGVGCTGSGTISGTMTQGVAVSGVTMTLYANVTQIGSWSLSATNNGVTFTGSSAFTNLGCQAITLYASGTPTAAGSTTWTTNSTPAGSSTATVQSAAPNGTVSALNCAGATHTGTLTGGTAASGISSSVPYTGGNGGPYTAFSIASTGITGLTASIAAGSFATGAGTLTVNITGTPSGAGTATFALTIGGQSCNLTRTVNPNFSSVADAASGTLGGNTCFDIAESNDNTNGCGALSGRAASRANFNLTATNTQTYTFTPSGAVSNVRFYFVNTGGQVIQSITGGNSGTNISTAQTASVVYNTALSSPNPASPTSALALGRTATNPLTADIYVVFNDNATNTGTDRKIKLTPQIKDCACCGAMISATVWKEFLCHNLGANTSLDPHTPVVGLQGAYIQWGRRGPNTTGDSRVDWVTAGNTSNFAAAPTATNDNSGIISNWSTSLASDYSWRTATGTKTANDPCPAGYRVPTLTEVTGIGGNNTVSRTGTWNGGNTEYGSAVHFGPNATTKTLTVPASGFRGTTVSGGTNGEITYRGSHASFWSSTEVSTNGGYYFYATSSTVVYGTTPRTQGFPIRCIKE